MQSCPALGPPGAVTPPDSSVRGLPRARMPQWFALVAQVVKNLPVMQETRVRSLGREDRLEKDVAAHSSVLAWRAPRTEEPGGLQSTGLREWDTTERLTP